MDGDQSDLFVDMDHVTTKEQIRAVESCRNTIGESGERVFSESRSPLVVIFVPPTESGPHRSHL
jgi:hypothetical protein